MAIELLKRLMGKDDNTPTAEELEKANKGLFASLQRERKKRHAAEARALEAETAVVQLGRKLERLMLSGGIGQVTAGLADSITAARSVPDRADSAGSRRDPAAPEVPEPVPDLRAGRFQTARSEVQKLSGPVPGNLGQQAEARGV